MQILLEIYLIFACIWAYAVEVKYSKGLLVRIGFIVYFPFVAIVCWLNPEYKIKLNS